MAGLRNSVAFIHAQKNIVVLKHNGCAPFLGAIRNTWGSPKQWGASACLHSLLSGWTTSTAHWASNVDATSASLWTKRIDEGV